MSLEFFIDYNLIGINDRYFISHGKNILSSRYRQCKESLKAVFFKYEKIDIPKKPYKITIQSHQYHDIDAFIKVILDSLQEAGIIEDDKYVLSLQIIKTPIKKGGDQSHLIRVENYGI